MGHGRHRAFELGRAAAAKSSIKREQAHEHESEIQRHRRRVLDVIAAEHLQYYNWYTPTKRQYEAGIVAVEGGWLVYVTDERAAWDSYRPVVHADEHEALDDFLERLRLTNRVVDRMLADGPLPQW